MKRFRNFVPLLLLFLVACSAAPKLEPTAASTLTATLTPLPTKTSTPVPTATRNAPATAIAKATSNADDILSELDGLLHDSDIPYQQGYLAWQYEEPISVNLTGPEQKLQSLDEKLTASNFVLKSDVTWTATGIIICGANFRAEPDFAAGKQYQFLFLRLSGLPAWSIDVLEFGQFKNSITKTQYSSALDQGNGATNQFILVAQDEQFTLYINHIRQGRYFDTSKQRSDGAFAFFALQDSGKGSCKFENSWIWSLEPPPPGGLIGMK